MYQGWTALVMSQLVVELPWNMTISATFFCRYWTIARYSGRLPVSHALCRLPVVLYYVRTWHRVHHANYSVYFTTLIMILRVAHFEPYYVMLIVHQLWRSPAIQRANW